LKLEYFYLGIFTPRTDWILFTWIALYTQLPPRSISAMMPTSILHFCASSFWVSFFSHRAWRMASLVSFLIYFVFFAVSSPVPALVSFNAEVVAATMADAEFLVAAIDASVGLDAAAALYDETVDVGLVLLIVTGVQS